MQQYLGDLAGAQQQSDVPPVFMDYNPGYEYMAQMYPLLVQLWQAGYPQQGGQPDVMTTTIGQQLAQALAQMGVQDRGMYS